MQECCEISSYISLGDADINLLEAGRLCKKTDVYDALIASFHHGKYIYTCRCNLSQNLHYNKMKGD